MKTWLNGWADIYQSPFRLLVLMALSIFIMETAVMAVIHLMPSDPEGYWEGLLDSSLLVLLLSPMLFYLFLRPLLLNIGERKRSEEALLAERDRLERVTQDIGAGLAIISRDCKTLWANGVLKQMFGEVEGVTCYAACNGAVHCADCGTRGVFVRGTAKSVRQRLMSFHGAKVWTEIVTTPLTDRNGDITAALELVLPITERKQAEEERARLAAVVKSAADAIVVTDTRGIIRYVNEAFSHITGYAREEVIGHDLHMLDSGSLDEQSCTSMREAVGRGDLWRGTLSSRKKDGALYYEECSIAPVKNCSGEVINYVSVRRDITEKLRLESIAEAVETMNNIGYIFSGIRHEIGNPLNTIRINLRALVHHLDDALTEKSGECVNRMLTEIARVDYLLTMLKNFNMYENLRLANIELDTFADNFMSLIEYDTGKQGIAIETSIHPDAALGYADPRALQQVILNILSNAVDALKGRENAKIIIDTAKMSDVIRVRIADNGCGMSEVEQGKLFKPFHTSKAKGTGLGLVIAKKIMTRMNGGIRIRSKKNEGTVVDLFIPKGKDAEFQEQKSASGYR